MLNECANYQRGNVLLLILIGLLIWKNYKLKKELLKEGYNEGFKDGLNACKPNKKLDKAIKKGIEL